MSRIGGSPLTVFIGIKALQVKIIANGIKNLTDARYFAAMGVDWIGFDMGMNSPLSIEQVVAFADWVEGPEFFLDVTGRSADQIAGILGTFNASGLLADVGLLLPHYPGKMIKYVDHDEADIDHTDIQIFTLNEWDKRVSAITTLEADEVWIKIADVTEYQKLKESAELISGIVISGGDEQKVGVKAYDDLDEIIELIRG